MKSLSIPKIIAHRGASAFAPENTLAALRMAQQLGLQWVEFDVMLTSDDVPIIFHDRHLERTTNGRGLVRRTSYSAIAQLDAGSWFSPEFKGERVPTLTEWLMVAAELKLGINLEMKVSGRRAKFLALQIHQQLSRYWNADLPPPLISSFYVSCLKAIHQIAPEYNLAFNLSKWSRNWQRITKRLDCVSLHLYYKRANSKRVARIHELGMKALVYTIDEPLRAQQLLDNGVDGIFSNRLTSINLS